MAAASSLQKILTAPLVSSSILLSSSFLQVRQEASASRQVPQHNVSLTGRLLVAVRAACHAWPPATPQQHHRLNSEHTHQHQLASRIHMKRAALYSMTLYSMTLSSKEHTD